MVYRLTSTSYVHCTLDFEQSAQLRLGMSDSTLNNPTLYGVLSIVGLGWYVVLWSTGLLGCWTG